MKIVIIHGDHTNKSQQRKQKMIDVAKDRGWEIRRFGSNASFAEVVRNQGLFEKEKLIIVDGASSLKKKDYDWLKKNGDKVEANVLIYNRTLLGKRAISAFGKVHKVEEFTLPKLIWKFLDSIVPGNTKNAVSLFHQVVETQNPEFVFALFAKHIRDLYWAQIDPGGIPYPSWRVGKLKSQSAKFSKTQLEALIKELAEIDISSKTSKANVTDSLDFLLLTHLE